MILSQKAIKLLEALSHDDWHFIEYATQERFIAAEPKKGEGKPSQQFIDQRSRIMRALQTVIYQ